MSLYFAEKGVCSLKSLPASYCVDDQTRTGAYLTSSKVLRKWLDCGLDPPYFSVHVSRTHMYSKEWKCQ